jgi:poly(hydroxyalkanoate) granule-associated protein
MVKKLKAMAEKSSSESQLRAAVKDSAQEIWLAGLGAFAKAQEEGQKVFKALVREGTSIQKRTMKVTEERSAVTAVTKVAAGLQKQANGTWDKRERVPKLASSALTRLGCRPTRNRRADRRVEDARHANPARRRRQSSTQGGLTGRRTVKAARRPAGKSPRGAGRRGAAATTSPACGRSLTATAYTGRSPFKAAARRLHAPLLGPRRQRPVGVLRNRGAGGLGEGSKGFDFNDMTSMSASAPANIAAGLLRGILCADVAVFIEGEEEATASSRRYCSARSAV